MNTNEKRVHAMTMLTRVLCGQRARNIRTSIVAGPKDREFWSIVTCQRCRMYRKGARYD